MPTPLQDLRDAVDRAAASLGAEPKAPPTLERPKQAEPRDGLGDHRADQEADPVRYLRAYSHAHSIAGSALPRPTQQPDDRFS